MQADAIYGETLCLMQVAAQPDFPAFQAVRRAQRRVWASDEVPSKSGQHGHLGSMAAAGRGPNGFA
jgi:hypothetical protein